MGLGLAFWRIASEIKHVPPSHKRATGNCREVPAASYSYQAAAAGLDTSHLQAVNAALAKARHYAHPLHEPFSSCSTPCGLSSVTHCLALISKHRLGPVPLQAAPERLPTLLALWNAAADAARHAAERGPEKALCRCLLFGM